MIVLGYAFLFLVLMPLLSVWRGYIFSILWGWFIIPIFGVSQISIPLAIGLSYVIHFLTEKMPKKNEKPFSEQMALIFSYGTVGPLFTLGFAWIVHQFV